MHACARPRMRARGSRHALALPLHASRIGTRTHLLCGSRNRHQPARHLCGRDATAPARFPHNPSRNQRHVPGGRQRPSVTGPPLRAAPAGFSTRRSTYSTSNKSSIKCTAIAFGSAESYSKDAFVKLGALSLPVAPVSRVQLQPLPHRRRTVARLAAAHCPPPHPRAQRVARRAPAPRLTVWPLHICALPAGADYGKRLCGDEDYSTVTAVVNDIAVAYARATAATYVSCESSGSGVYGHAQATARAETEAAAYAEALGQGWASVETCYGCKAAAELLVAASENLFVKAVAESSSEVWHARPHMCCFLVVAPDAPCARADTCTGGVLLIGRPCVVRVPYGVAVCSMSNGARALHCSWRRTATPAAARSLRPRARWSTSSASRWPTRLSPSPRT